jgi:uncharacterized protein YkwD
MHTDPVSLRSGAARLRLLCLRAGAVIATLVAVAATPAIAAAHGRAHHRHRPHRTTRTHRARRHTARRHRHHPRRHTSHARPHATAHARAHAAPTCVNAHARLGRVAHTETDAAVVCLLNVQRAQYGLPPVHPSRRLNHSAQRWTNVMVRNRAFSHGADFAARISAVGFRWSRVGENIADGFSTPAGVVHAWMRSTGHCENILNPMFREVGSGFDTGTAMSGNRHGTWTLDLALGWTQRAHSRNFGPAEGCPY